MHSQTVRYDLPIFQTEAEIWLHSGCHCCYSTSEQVGFVQVCAEINYINGTANTTSDYIVTISDDSSTYYTGSYAAQSK